MRFEIPKSVNVQGFRVAVHRVEEEGYWGTSSIDRLATGLSAVLEQLEVEDARAL